MNKELWNNIVSFDLDNPISEYGFSTRLANENYWTKDFAALAILEYKKFMYLAATSEFMVSPSEIVDVVWHQHLIFTQSYQEFCVLLGKQIQHLPSTHNKEDFQKFQQAKERTMKFYLNNFGEQPMVIWDYAGMYESLQIDKARFKIRTFIIIGILTFAALTIPCYFLLRPLYITIDNPWFIIGFIALTVLAFIGLEIFNRSQLLKIVNGFNKNAFVFNLQPLELVYLQTQKLSNVINGVVSQLIEKDVIEVNSDHTIQQTTRISINSIEEHQVLDSLSSLGKPFYPTLLIQLLTKPVFWNIANCMDAFKKYFNKSKKFGTLFYINFAVLSMLLMLCFIRLSTGLLRDKPVTLILIVIVFLIIMIIVYLSRLTRLVCIQTIPTFYKTEILPTREIADNWQWNYFLLGSAVLTTSFVPLVDHVNKNNSSSGSCGTSCGSSCGSSCSSCGGCGGD